MVGPSRKLWPLCLILVCTLQAGWSRSKQRETIAVRGSEQAVYFYRRLRILMNSHYHKPLGLNLACLTSLTANGQAALV